MGGLYGGLYGGSVWGVCMGGSVWGVCMGLFCLFILLRFLPTKREMDTVRVVEINTTVWRGSPGRSRLSA